MSDEKNISFLSQALCAIWLVAALLLASQATAWSQQEQPPKNYALLIGINRYLALDDLKHAVDDATELGDILSDKGYEVTQLTRSVRRRDVVGQLSYLAQNVRPQDTLLIYFAGHGVRVKVGQSSHTYWVTHDATLALIEAEAIRLTHLLDYVNDVPARRKMIILDHCHSGDVELRAAVAEGRRDGSGPLSITRNLFPTEEFKKQVNTVEAEGLVVMAAATDRAYEFPDLGHGLMTHVLIEALTTTAADTNNDGKLSVLELKERRSVVDDLAAQRNVTQTSVWVERGVNLDWFIADIEFLPQELKRVVAQLMMEGQLPFKHVITCREAIQALEAGTMLIGSRNHKIVDLLKQIRDAGTAISWSAKAELVSDALQATGGNP